MESYLSRKKDPLVEMLRDEGFDNPGETAERLWSGETLGPREGDNPGEIGPGGVREPREPEPNSPAGNDQLPIPAEPGS